MKPRRPHEAGDPRHYIITDQDNSLPVLILAIGHRAAATQRSARRDLARRARKAVHQAPEGRLDVLLYCEDDRSCCRAEAFEVTARRLREIVEDATGLRPYAVAASDGWWLAP